MGCGPQVNPWKGCFAGARVVKEVTINSDEAETGERLRLSAVDSSCVLLGIFPSFALVFEEALDFDKLQSAATELLRRYPFFGGRARTDREHLEVELNNTGFPLTAIEWPEGCLDDFPAALCAKDWEGELPANIKAPIIFQDFDPMETFFNNGPMFALRLTTFGKGPGCVLTCTLHHILADGERMMNSLADLSRAYRGERLKPLGRWLHRDLMSKENIHQLLTGGKALVQEACDAVKDDPPLPPQTTFRDILEATVAKPGRDIVTWAWESSPGIPKGPMKQAFVMLHVLKSELAQLKEEVIEYAFKHGDAMPAHVSTCNVLVGLMWCLKCACVNAPLPGQGGIVLPEVSFASLDIAYNSLKGPAKEGFFGNAATGAPIILPPSAPPANGASEDSANGEGSKSNGNSVPDFSRGALLKAIGIIAAGHRAIIDDWRNPNGNSIREFLQGLCSPQRFYKECAMIEGIALSGALTGRAVVTSWDRFPVKKVMFDEAVGPALHFLPHWNYVASAMCTVVAAMDDSGLLVHMCLPTDHTSAALETARTVLPKAAYV